MTVILLILFVTLISYYFSRGIKKYAVYIYWASIVLCCILFCISFSGMARELPSLFRSYVFSPIRNGILPTAIFIIIMFVGAFENKSILRKKILPIRAELAIIASIFTFAHFILCIRHFTRLFTPQLFTSSLLHTASMLVGTYALIMIIPLFVTSFHKIRKKMQRLAWVNLQNFAYLVYAFTYLHIMLLDLPKAFPSLRDVPSNKPPMNLPFYFSGAFINILIYSTLFWGYTILRIDKEIKLRKEKGCKNATLATLCQMIKNLKKENHVCKEQAKESLQNNDKVKPNETVVSPIKL